MQKPVHEPDLEPIWITIVYDPAIRRITRKAIERTMCNRGCPFLFILNSVFVEYPAISRKYAPGFLGFTVNGEPPASDRPMSHGDIVEFVVCDTLDE